MRRAECENKTGTLQKKPDKFKFGDKVRCIGNTAFTKSDSVGVVVGHSNIVCPMSKVLFDNGKIGYISDNELSLEEGTK